MKNFLYFIGGMFILTVFSLVYLQVSFAEAFEDAEDFENFWDEEVLVEENDENFEMEEEVLDYMGIVKMESEFLDGDILKISVLAEEMQTPVLGLAFNLKFNKENVAFLKYQPGNFLERGGDPFYLVTNNDENGKIVFGETLRRKDDFPIGTGRVADFYFQIREENGLKFTFENGVVSTLDTVRQDIEKIIWEDLSIDKNGDSTIDIMTTNVSALGMEKHSNFWNFGLGMAIGVLIFGGIFWVYLRSTTRSVNFK